MLTRPHRRSGFTLIELMIVVAIIAIISAIAIPSLLNSRKSAIEAKAIGTLKAIITGNEQYRLRFGRYAPTPDMLGTSGIVPAMQAPNFFPEYTVVAYASNSFNWAISVRPQDPGVTADRSFYTDVTGVIRTRSGGPATSTDPPID